MDLNSLVGTLLSADSISSVAQRTGLSEKDVQNVMVNALPLLLNGANQQATQQSTAASFTNALNQHAQSNTSNLSSFLGNVDLDDGAKIVAHLLGQNASQSVAQQSGVSNAATQSVMSAAAPLLMSMLGQQNQTTNGSAASMMSSLLGNADMASVLAGALTGSAATTTTGKKKKKTSDAGALLGLLGKLLK